MNPKKWIPWQAKIAAKIVLSRLPIPYRFWRAVSCFDLGPMEKPEYAYAVFREHYDRAAPPAPEDGFVCLELGPGNTLFTAVIARAFGAKKTYLVDEGAFAAESPARISGNGGATFSRRRAGRAGSRPLPDAPGRLARDGCPVPHRGSSVTRSASRRVPCTSLFSHAVLEHVRREDFEPTLRELSRILHHDGVASHRVDFTDHLNGRLDSLRFSMRRWESRLFAASGFYTNRLRYSEILEACAKAGMIVETPKVERWPELPTAREKLATPFRDLPESDLKVFACDLLLRPVR